MARDWTPSRRSPACARKYWTSSGARTVVGRRQRRRRCRVRGPKFTCGFLAWLVYTRFVLLVPINRIYQHLRRQNLGVPRSSLIRLIEIGSDLAAAVDGVHWKELKRRHCILTDATGVKVLVELSLIHI